MDVRDLLAVDHREVVELARLVHRSSDGACRVAAHRRLGDALRTHALAEERVVHAALACARTADRATLTDARRAHTQAECLIARLVPPLEAYDDGWQAAWQDVIDALVSHIDDEEQQLFTALGSDFSAMQREELATRYLQARRDAALVPPPS